MSRLFWLSLLLGYVAGIAIAIVFLPDPVLEPFYGALALGSVALVGGVSTLLAFAGSRTRARRAAPASPPATTEDDVWQGAQTETPIADRPVAVAERAAETAAVAEADDDHDGAIGTAPDTVTRHALVRILSEERVDVLALPVAALADDGFAYVDAVPRLRTARGRHLEPAEYRALAARWGLTAELDRLLLRRCAAVVASALGRGEEVRVLCSIAATSLDDPDLITALRRLVDDRELAERLIVTVDRTRLHRPARAELARLVEDGLNVCLRRLSIETIDLPGLAEAGFAFVKLDAPQHALGSPEAPLSPPLEKLRQRFARSAITVLVDLRAEAVLLPGAEAAGPTDVPARARGPESSAA